MHSLVSLGQREIYVSHLMGVGEQLRRRVVGTWMWVSSEEKSGWDLEVTHTHYPITIRS